MEWLFGIIICLCIVCVWGAIIIAKNKKRKLSLGQFLVSASITIVGIGLLLFSFDIVSKQIYMIIVGVGILTGIVALFFTLKRSEF